MCVHISLMKFFQKAAQMADPDLDASHVLLLRKGLKDLCDRTAQLYDKHGTDPADDSTAEMADADQLSAGPGRSCSIRRGRSEEPSLNSGRLHE
jgi:hypothetical protein